MAVHLKMDFRVVELTRGTSVLQCDRDSGRHGSCRFEVEYSNKTPGALVQAIHSMKLHNCEAAASTHKPKSAQAVLPLVAKRCTTVAIG
jgi:hypothetical protein